MSLIVENAKEAALLKPRPATSRVERPGTTLSLLLSPTDLKDYFPEGLGEVADRVTEIKHYSPVSDFTSWPEFLHREQPTILVAGRNMPPLPPYLELGFKPDLQYLCFLAGSIRKRIPCCWIDHGLIVTNWGSSIGRIVAECALMMILSSLRCVAEYQEIMHHIKGWKPRDKAARPERSLFGRTVGIHGFGKVAQALVKLLRPFEIRILAYTPSIPEGDWSEVIFCETLESLFSQSDILVEVAPLNRHTERLVGRELLNLLPDEASFINVGRGMVVREDDLLEVALRKKLRLALDVYENEPLPANSPLRSHPEILLMPHQAGPTRDRIRDIGDHALAQISRYLRGEMPLDVISSDIWKEIT